MGRLRGETKFFKGGEEGGFPYGEKRIKSARSGAGSGNSNDYLRLAVVAKHKDETIWRGIFPSFLEKGDAERELGGGGRVSWNARYLLNASKSRGAKLIDRVGGIKHFAAKKYRANGDNSENEASSVTGFEIGHASRQPFNRDGPPPNLPWEGEGKAEESPCEARGVCSRS